MEQGALICVETYRSADKAAPRISGRSADTHSVSVSQPEIQRVRLKSFALAPLLMLSAPFSAAAGPWLDPGDTRLRHDLQLLGDVGLIPLPLMTWPLSVPEDILKRVTYIDASSLTDPVLKAAFERVNERLRRESLRGRVSPQARLAAARYPMRFRTFADTPREPAEAGAGLAWMGERFFYRLQAAAVDNPDDRKVARLDGTYLGGSIGNWILSLAAVDRWWGPGWEGSLILSQNARPVPGVTVQRRHAEPFRSRLLSWVGPWQFVFFLGRLEREAFIPDANLMGARLTFKPTRDLEIGLSRTAQWGGEGRPEDFRTLVNLLIGHENRGNGGITATNDPGNQLAGYDLRWVSPLFDLPYAVYGQFIGEDEAGGLPSRFIGLAGVELWGGWGSRGASYRLHVESADTTAGFYTSTPLYNYAYEHGIYQSGYRYYGRSIGHSLDGDGRMTSVGMLWVDEKSRAWETLVRRIDPDRDAPGAKSFLDGSLRHTISIGEDNITLEAGLQHERGGGGRDGRAAVQWSRMF